MKRARKSFVFVLSLLLLLSFCQPVLAGKGKVNINTATKKELVTLKGIGDKIAARIIEYR